MLTRKALCKVVACAVAAGLGSLAAFGATRVGVINWDCSPPSDTWFGGYQTRSLSPARYRYLTPYYADAKGPDEISYHRRTPAEYDRELQYAIDAGIDYFAYCWYGEDPHAKRVPLHSGRSISCEDHLWEITWARQFHMKSPLREKLGLCAIVLGAHVYTDEEVVHLAEAMREPCYEKVAGGRPLLYIFGDVTKGEILARIRRAARTVDVPDPFVVAMHGTRKTLPATGDRSVQARTFYAPPAPPKGGAFLRYPDMYAAIRRVNASWIDQGFDIVPAFATGRDHWPRIEHQVPWTDNPPMRYASPATERELVECAKDFKAFMDANRAKCPLDHVLTYAWNEFEEGAYICPLWAPNGGADVSRLKAFAKVARIFKGEQGVTAVPDDPLPDLADLRKRLPEIFKGCEGSSRHEWFATRLEAAERLAALPTRTPLMQAELDEFRVSFRDALAHDDEIEAVPLLDGFISPPKGNYPSMWVFKLGVESPREVITHDLEEFTKVGISEFMIIGNGAALTAAKPYGEPALKGKMHGVRADRLRWALHEANRLGLGVWIMLGPGGCGNNKCPPELAQKYLMLTTARATAGADGMVRVTLPKKGAKETPHNKDGSPMYYWDVATLAVPVKDGFVQTNEVIDVSAQLDRASGTLSWKAPHVGDWLLVRAGTVPKMFGFAGCFIDHMSKAAFDAHWDQVMQPLLDAITPDERAALKGVWCDSWEAGTINWTWDFAEEFTRRRGYDFLTMLPAKVGVKMVSAERTRQFLRDWDVTVGELIAENHYAYQKEVANKHGLLSSAEGCGPHLHHGDPRTMQGRCDVAMGEFWMPSPHRPEDSQRFMLRDSATAAHVYGMGTVESEAFTTMGTHWEESPAMFKPCADRAFCDGLTRVCYHGMLMSVPLDAFPGDTRRAGAYYSPKVTWWKYSAPMNLYFARCSWMLSRGRFAADCLLYAGDATDLFLGMKYPDDGLGVGYDYDLCPTELLLRARVENGEIVLPSGMRYKTLFLSDINPARARMAPGRLKPLKAPLPPVVHPIPPEAARKLAQLERDGATILRTRADMKKFLDANSLPPDFMVEEEAVRAGIDWIHRTDRTADIYFISNQRGEATRFTAAFRQKSCHVELWDAVTGTRTPVPCEPTADGHRVRLNLALAAGGSVFVVFPTGGSRSCATATGGSRSCATADAQERVPPRFALTGPWSVSFDPKWGGPAAPITFPALTDWTQHADPGIRFYSGTAVYRKTFDAPPNCPTGSPVTIDLGDLRDVAHVTLNGRPLGVAWTPPYAVTAPRLKATGNVLEIAVVNLWANRLIGDAALPAAERIANLNASENPFKKDHPLLPSGLFGPVSIRWP